MQQWAKVWAQVKSLGPEMVGERAVGWALSKELGSARKLVSQTGVEWGLCWGSGSAEAKTTGFPLGLEMAFPSARVWLKGISRIQNRSVEHKEEEFKN